MSTEYEAKTEGGEQSEKYSKDFQKLLEYKADPSDKTQLKIVRYFCRKYYKLIKIYRWKYLRWHIFKSKSEDVDYLEMREQYTMDKLFYIKQYMSFGRIFARKYLVQALNSVKLEKIYNKDTYVFATYINFYLKNEVRDLSRRRNRIIKKAIQDRKTLEEETTDKIMAEQIRAKVPELRKKLTPNQKIILDALIEKKKQKDIVLINPETGKNYTKGAISKEVKKIRTMFKTMLDL